MILVINTNGDRLCKDNRWRGFANFGTYQSCVKTYRTLGPAHTKAARVAGVVVCIPAPNDRTGISYSVDASGKVIKKSPADKPGYERVSHLELKEFTVLRRVS